MDAVTSLNANPVVSTQFFRRNRPIESADIDDEVEDLIDGEEIFQLIRDIKDPEHPFTLEQLNVVSHGHIDVIHHLVPLLHLIRVEFTPTIPHCSMATLIGLCIRVKLLRSLPFYYKVSVCIRPGTHQSEHAINKQLNDKERVAAALENPQLLGLVNKCLE
jgi:metal-sulfur cluster biosynthetic enzyme